MEVVRRDLKYYDSSYTNIHLGLVQFELSSTLNFDLEQIFFSKFEEASSKSIRNDTVKDSHDILVPSEQNHGFRILIMME